MNSLYRAILLQVSSSRSLAKKGLLLTALTLQSYGTASPRYHTTKYPPSASKRPKPQKEPPTVPRPPLGDGTEWPRPSEIPYQPKIANNVNIIGYIHSPIQYKTSSDGKFFAATVLTRNKNEDPFSDDPSVWIPIIFEGDLAHVAVCHLKENDRVYVGGHLSGFSSSETSEVQNKVQVVVRSIHFVQASSQSKMVSAPREATEFLTSESEKDNIYITMSLRDLMARPEEWRVITSEEDTLGVSVFERKDNGEVLRIDESTPDWIRQKLESITFDQKSVPKGMKTTATKSATYDSSHWRELLDNPKQWWDYRSNKLSNLVNPRHPDFKHKDSGTALWLDSAPEWVLSKIKEMEFDVPVSKQTQVNKGYESWKNLVENPADWWDNRLSKKKEKAPDFKHKTTGEVLWLNSAPAWVLTKLPQQKLKKEVTSSA